MLKQELQANKTAIYAESTKATYKSHLRAYLRFCIYIECDPVPINNTNLLLYAVFLARTLKPDSVRQYLNIVRLIHLESGLPNPLEGNYALKIDRARLAEKSARKDEKTLFWPPPTSLVWLPNQQETKQCRNN